jgi:hypothetical protein
MTHERSDCKTDASRNARDNAALTQLIVDGDERSGGEHVRCAPRVHFIRSPRCR